MEGCLVRPYFPFVIHRTNFEGQPKWRGCPVGVIRKRVCEITSRQTTQIAVETLLLGVTVTRFD